MWVQTDVCIQCPSSAPLQRLLDGIMDVTLRLRSLESPNMMCDVCNINQEQAIQGKESGRDEVKAPQNSD